MTRFLTPVALDFLWETTATGEPPYPLEVQSHGTTMDERTTLRHRAFDDLRAQHMLDPQGHPAPEIEGWLTLLTQGTQSVDAVFEDTSALAVGDGTQALLAVQSADGLTLRSIDPSSLASTVVALLPPHPRGTERSVSMPAADLDSPRSERDRQVLKALAQHQTLRAGQLAANARHPMGSRKRAPVLSWFDTTEGRYLTYTKKSQDGTDWVTIAPADQATLRACLTELLNSLSR